MAQNRNSWCQGLGLAIAGALIELPVGIIASSGSCALAQIKPDATLGSERSSVTRNVSIKGLSKIEGGAKRGANLFHSFEEFNIEEGRGAYFANPAGIENILSRVTGNNRSDIQGTLGVLGKANLFLINPNGIIFGPNASLDVNGSFVATTANAIQFDNQGFFSASAPDTPVPVLTINPSAFLFNQIAAQPISNKSVVPNFSDRSSIDGLRVPDGQSLLLVGGDIRLEGGQVRAQSGRVELGGVAETGTVGLDDNLHLSFPQGVERADVFLSNEAAVSANGAGGNVEVQGRRVTLTDGSQIRANALGSEPGGTLTVRASESVELAGAGVDGFPSGLFVQTQGTGDAGDLRIVTGQLSVRDGARISAATFGRGNAGNVNIIARDGIFFDGVGSDGFPSGAFSSVDPRAAGKGGSVNLITTGSLSLTNGAQVSAATFGQGDAGRMNIDVAGSTVLIGTSANGQFASGIRSAVEENATGAGGDLNLLTGRLLVQDGAQVSAAALGDGRGGSLNVVADAIELVGSSADNQLPSGLFTTSGGAEGAVDLRIKTGQLSVRDGAEASVSSQGTGNAGDLQVVARSILLENQAALTAKSASGEGGNIELQTQDLLLMRQNSNISAFSRTEGGGGKAGNIHIDTNILVAVENSDIIADYFAGPRVNVSITALGYLRSSDSQVIINGEEIELPEGLERTFLEAPPPSEVVDISGLVVQMCPVGRGAGKRAASRFVVTGRGGLPPSPSDSLDTDAVQVGLVTLKPEVNKPSTAAVSTSSTNPVSVPIVEAQGWVRGPGGEIVLTAQAPTVTSHPGLAPASCRGS